tara:strand:- start:1947 stop:3836 length:1890 start_codon:yes stop_codon:yes gene_type:complete
MPTELALTRERTPALVHVLHTFGFYSTARDGHWVEASRHAREACVHLNELSIMHGHAAPHLLAHLQPNHTARTLSWCKLCGAYARMLATLEIEHRSWNSIQLFAPWFHANSAAEGRVGASWALLEERGRWRTSASCLYEQLCDHCAKFECVAPLRASMGTATMARSTRVDLLDFKAKTGFDGEAVTAAAAVTAARSHTKPLSVSEHVTALLKLGCGVALVCWSLHGAHKALQVLRAVLEGCCSQVGGPGEHGSNASSRRDTAPLAQTRASVNMPSSNHSKRFREPHVVAAARPLSALLDEALRRTQLYGSDNVSVAAMQAALAWVTALGAHLLFAAGDCNSCLTLLETCDGDATQAPQHAHGCMGSLAQERSERKPRSEGGRERSSEERCERSSQAGDERLWQEEELLKARGSDGEVWHLFSLLKGQVKALELLCSASQQPFDKTYRKWVAWEEFLAPACGGRSVATSAVAVASLHEDLIKLRGAAASCLWLMLIKRDDAMLELIEIHRGTRRMGGDDISACAAGAGRCTPRRDIIGCSVDSRIGTLEHVQLSASEAALLLERSDAGAAAGVSAAMAATGAEKFHALNALLFLPEGGREHSIARLERRCKLERSSATLLTLLGALHGEC